MENSYVNKDFGVLTVLEFSHKVKYRKFYSCRCNRCGALTKVRTDHLIKLPKSCGSCVNTLQKEIAQAKYKPEVTKFNALYCAYRIGAGTRQLEFSIDKVQFASVLKDSCYYCGEPGHGLDRIDSNKGYFLANVVSCCSMCNIMKNKFSQESFFEKIEKIYNKHLK